MERIRQLFESQVPLKEGDWDLFSSRLSEQRHGKRSVLLKVGQIERWLSFVEQGMVRFYVPGDDQDLTFAFAFQGAFMSAYDSFLTQAPCTYQVETLAATVLWRISFTDLQDIYRRTETGNLIGRLAGEDLFLKKARRELSLLKDSAQDRYLQLFTERPELVRHIPQKYLASYIGITPQALSRIRRRIS